MADQDKEDAVVRAAKIAVRGAIASASIAGIFAIGSIYFSSRPASSAVKDAIASEEAKLKIQSVAFENNEITNGLFPGEIRAFAFGGTKSDPLIQKLRMSGWLECGGQPISQSDYPRLYAVLEQSGHPWGRKTEGGRELMRIPDLRGVFLRGWMDGRTDVTKGDPGDGRNAPDREGTGASGNKVGSFQLDQFQTHTHEYNRGARPGVDDGSTSGTSENTGAKRGTTGDIVVGGRNGSETRSKNVYVMYCIYTGKPVVADTPDGSNDNQ
jgi:hypothetical protein